MEEKLKEMSVVERKLRESEEKYKTLATRYSLATHAAKVGVWDWNIQTNDFYIDPNIKAILGYKDEEIPNDINVWTTYVHPDDLQPVMEAAQAHLEGKTPKYVFNHRMIHKDGSIRWIRVRGEAIRDTQGNAIRMVGTDADITESKIAEQKLKESEEKYRLITENANDLITVLSDKFEHEYINEQTYLKVLGYSKEDMLGMTRLDLVHPDDLKRVAKGIKDGFKYGKGKIELRLRHKNGQYIWFEVKGRSFKNKEGKIKALTISRDITERKKAEQNLKKSEAKLRKLNIELEQRIEERTKELKESEERYRLISENANDLIMILDDKLKIKYINEQFTEEVMGYSKDYVIDKSGLDFVHPEDIKKTLKSFRKVLDFGVETTEIRLIKNDGDFLWFEIKGKTFLDIDGKKKVILICRDTTLKKEAEQQLKESEEKYRNLFEKASFSIILFNFEGRIIDCNSSTEKIFGYKKDELIGKNYLDISAAPPDQLPLFKRRLQLLMEGKTPEIAKLQIFKKDGSPIWILSSASPVRIGDNTYFQAVIQDITEKERSEQKLKESEENYREAYNLVNFYKDLFAHDMNNILQSILSSAEYFSYFRNDPEKLKDFGDISELVKMHVGRGTSLISKVRALSKLEETEINLIPIGVFDILNKSVENTGKSFLKKNINIRIEGLSKDLNVLGNDLLIDVFDNLLHNAVKFSDGDKESIVDIIISKIQADDINYIKFEIKDYGRGIPDDRKEFLFEELFEKDKFKRGMGIGLSLVKKIVDKYDGKIWVEDRIKGNYKEGSNFVVLLKEAD